MENESLAKELAELRSIREQQTMTSSNVEAQLNAARAEKDQIIEELMAEKERLQQQIDHLQNVSSPCFDSTVSPTDVNIIPGISF